MGLARKSRVWVRFGYCFSGSGRVQVCVPSGSCRVTVILVGFGSAIFIVFLCNNIFQTS